MSEYTNNLTAEQLIRYIANDYVELSHDNAYMVEVSGRDDHMKICREWLANSYKNSPYYTTADKKYEDLPAAVRQFFAMLDIVEESDSGNEFHPISIGNCRAMLQEPLENILTQMKEMSRER